MIVSIWIQLKRKQNVAKNIKRRESLIVETAQNSK